MDAKDAKGLAGEVAKIRTQWLAIVRNLGVENLAPAEERTRVDRLEKALGQVFRLGWPIGITGLAESALFSATSMMMGWIGTVLGTILVIAYIALIAWAVQNDPTFFDSNTYY